MSQFPRIKSSATPASVLDETEGAFITAAAKLLAPPSYVSGNYYLCSSSQLTTTGTTGNGTARVTEWIINTPVTIPKFFAEFSAAGEANSVFRIGIWYPDGNGGMPGTLALDAGTISTGTGNAGNVATGGTPGVYEITLGTPLTLQPGVYWSGGAIQGAPTTQPTMRCVNLAPLFPGGPLGTSLPSANSTYVGFAFSASGAFGAASSPNAAGSAPRIGFKAA